MAICPNCKKKIEELWVESKAKIFYVFSVGCRFSDYSEVDRCVTNEVFTCPECDKDLFDDEEDAETFLKGGGNRK